APVAVDLQADATGQAVRSVGEWWSSVARANLGEWIGGDDLRIFDPGYPRAAATGIGIARRALGKEGKRDPEESVLVVEGRVDAAGFAPGLLDAPGLSIALFTHRSCGAGRDDRG